MRPMTGLTAQVTAKGPLMFVGRKTDKTSVLHVPNFLPSPPAAEYEAGSDVFVRKIRSLEGTYGAIRRARGDGNCFFRSFIFALFEHILQYRDYDERYRCGAMLPPARRARSA